MTDTLDRICADPLILDILGAQHSKPPPDAKLLEDFHLDSLDMVELAMALEEAFQIDIPDADWEDAADMTLAQVAELVDRRRAVKVAA
ncbi:acyl carrier protein [Niveispirillum sp.]|uniref:acyl carrier protein n=1 Tax=Niveispirillum sp. TaxID=1917217 RepID=UPI001B733244|nr:phosphopantetheine-binding protein [Niveispirillum sp.]MBP7337685.1 acyl carrier protein [Niveispirillum sp.]